MHNKILIFILLISFSISSSYADISESGPFTVKQLRFGQSGLHIALSPAPNSCGGGNQYGMHLKLDPTNEQYHDQMISGLLTAYASGTKLSRIWVRNEGTCSPTHILHLYILEYEAK